MHLKYLVQRILLSTERRIILWRRSLKRSGLSYFLGMDDRPSTVSDDLVDSIRNLVENWNSGGHSVRHLDQGMKVRVANGPFAGLEGIFQSHVVSRERCRILLDVLNRQALVEIPETDLAIAFTRT